MLVAALAGFECTLGGCPREFVEIDRAEFMRILRKEAGLLPVRKRRRPSRRKSDAPLSSPPDDPHISRSETPASRSAGGLNQQRIGHFPLASISFRHFQKDLLRTVGHGGGGDRKPSPQEILYRSNLRRYGAPVRTKTGRDGNEGVFIQIAAESDRLAVHIYAE